MHYSTHGWVILFKIKAANYPATYSTEITIAVGELFESSAFVHLISGPCFFDFSGHCLVCTLCAAICHYVIDSLGSQQKFPLQQ
jgi:hypothetical protein